MKKRALGFTLVAVSIVGALAAFATAEDYQPRLGIVNATQRAYVWTSCVRTPLPQNWWSESGLYDTATCSVVARRNHFTITLAAVLVACTAVGLAGVGTLVFGRG